MAGTLTKVSRRISDDEANQYVSGAFGWGFEVEDEHTAPTLYGRAGAMERLDGVTARVLFGVDRDTATASVMSGRLTITEVGGQSALTLRVPRYRAGSYDPRAGHGAEVTSTDIPLLTSERMMLSGPIDLIVERRSQVPR